MSKPNITKSKQKDIAKERIAIHKRFSNAETSPMRPGYRVSGFSTQQASAVN